MKTIAMSFALAALAMPLAASATAPAYIGDAGTYGRIDVTNKSNPRPRLIYVKPQTVDRGNENNTPVFLYIPKEQVRHWRDHCKEYAACDHPAYFVQEAWYTNTYIPEYRKKQGKPAAR